MQHEKHISIVIPTHNRIKSLELLLNGLGTQAYPMPLMEVIVVADGCRNDTIEMLRHYEAPYAFRYIAQDSQGPSVARNRGAAIATGELLLFLDDDIEPSAGLVAAHVRGHHAPNSVVIGYLPYHSPVFKGLYIARLRAWWENMFHSMRLNGYRFTYEDLLSGNFSLPAPLFKELNGFNETLRCREDYELGARLINAGASFIYSSEAWGNHKDEATDFNRSLQRKRQEGNADVQLARLHPYLINTLRLGAFERPYSKSKAALLFLVYRMPAVGYILALLFHKWLGVLEWLRFRHQWQRIAGQLQHYWYMKGVAAQLPTLAELHRFLQQPRAASPAYTIDIDIKNGLTPAEELLDLVRPAGARIMYGNQFVGYIPSKSGAERLRGPHLRTELATRLASALSKAMTLEKITAVGCAPAPSAAQPTAEAEPKLLNNIAYGH